MKLKPLEDRVIIKAVEKEETTASGIVLPDTARSDGTGTLCSRVLSHTGPIWYDRNGGLSNHSDKAHARTAVAAVNLPALLAFRVSAQSRSRRGGRAGGVPPREGVVPAVPRASPRR